MSKSIQEHLKEALADPVVLAAKARRIEAEWKLEQQRKQLLELIEDRP